MKEGRAGRTTEDETQPAIVSVEAFLAAVEQQVRRDDALVLAGTIQTGPEALGRHHEGSSS